MPISDEEIRRAKQQFDDVVHQGNAIKGTQAAPTNTDSIPDADMSGTRLAIDKCHSCGESHTALTCYPYQGASSLCSHWYQCPQTGDPVGVLIKEYNGKNAHLDDELMHKILEAQETGRWMAFVVTIDGDLSVAYRKAFDFPHARFEQAISAITNNLRKEVGPPQPDKPMAIAPPLKPITNIFGS